jgi:hypothetical protein
MLLRKEKIEISIDASSLSERKLEFEDYGFIAEHPFP